MTIFETYTKFVELYEGKVLTQDESDEARSHLKTLHDYICEQEGVIDMPEADKVVGEIINESEFMKEQEGLSLNIN